MKSKNFTISEFLLANFLSADIHSGELKRDTKKNCNQYLRGFRQKIGIVNMRYSAYHLAGLSYLITQLLNKDKKIVLVGFPDILDEEWGYLEYASGKRYVFIDYCWYENYLLDCPEEIGLILASSSCENFDYLLTEKKYIYAPFSGFTCSNVSYFDFFVVGNFQALECAIFFYYFLLNSLRFLKESSEKIL